MLNTNETSNEMNPYKFESGFNLRLFLIIISVCLLLGYGLFNARNLLIGPSIEIYSPPSLEIETEENTVTIKGRVKNMTYLSLSGRPIFVDTEGLFEEKLLLSPGFNIIEIRAKDRFKKEIAKTIKIYYKQSSATSTEL